MIEELNAGLVCIEITDHESEEYQQYAELLADVNLIINYVKEHVTRWDSGGSERPSFTEKFESILKNKTVHNDKEIARFKKSVEGKKEGVWMRSLLAAFNEVNYMDLSPELFKYGVASLQELVTKLSPLVFHVFTPLDDVTNDCLLAASNLEQPVWMFKNWVTREYALRVKCKDLLEKVDILSEKCFNTWTRGDCIESYKSIEFEMSNKFVIFLLYFYEIVDVEVFRDVYCLFFKTKVQSSWNEIFQRVRMKSIVDSKYKFDNVGIESTIVLHRSYHHNRMDLNNFLPTLGRNKEFVSTTKVLSPTTLAVVVEKYMPELNDLQSKLHQFYNSKFDFFSMKDEDIQTFTECVVKHHDVYQRAMIASIKSDTHVRVELTDMNWMITVAKSELMYLHSMFTQLPFLGFTLKLGHISSLIANREAVMMWLRNKLRVADVISIVPEVCRVNSTKRIVTVLLKVRNDRGNLLYLHELMAEKRLVTIDEEKCMYHATGLCL